MQEALILDQQPAGKHFYKLWLADTATGVNDQHPFTATLDIAADNALRFYAKEASTRGQAGPDVAQLQHKEVGKDSSLHRYLLYSTKRTTKQNLNPLRP